MFTQVISDKCVCTARVCVCDGTFGNIRCNLMDKRSKSGSTSCMKERSFFSHKILSAGYLWLWWLCWWSQSRGFHMGGWNTPESTDADFVAGKKINSSSFSRMDATTVEND